MIMFIQSNNEHTIMKKNEEYGPCKALRNTIEGDASTQSHLYQELQLYTLTEKCEHGTDYFRVLQQDGIDYYSPNDESWGGVVAVSEADKLALYTTFYETDDFDYPDSDYAMVVVDGKMGSRFEMIPFDAAMMDPEANK